MSDWFPRIRNREDQLVLLLTFVIGVLTGLAVDAFIVLTEHMGMRLYPVGSATWRRLLFPVLGSLGMGYLLYRYFPRRPWPCLDYGGDSRALRRLPPHYGPVRNSVAQLCGRAWKKRISLAS